MDINTRYKSLVDRSFKQHLRYKIFEAYVDGIISDVDLEGFTVGKATEAEFSSLYDNMRDVRSFNGKSRQYIADNKKEIKNYKNLYSKWFDINVMSLRGFGDYLGKHGMICDYCGVSESQIKTLHKYGELKTKRLYSRGKTMEIDRGKPNGEYSLGNIILSCYWCNNAKTDEFTIDEFMPIAAGIRATWDSRLASIADQEA